ncbi:MAG: insulinase family protein [Acidobacteria bacterium]|nr:MAG: insulinase family protein [Acidobacteriota bacterium]
MRRRLLSITLGLMTALIIAATSTHAEIGRPIALPDFQRQSLLNGMEIFAFAGNQERVPFQLVVVNGAAFDPAGKWGLTYLTTRLMVETGKDRSGQSLQTGLKAIGGELTYKVEWDGIWFQGSAPANRLTDTLNIVGQMIVQPQFEEESFAAIRDQVIAELQKKAGEPQFATHERFLAELFDGNPYGHLVRGNPTTLRNIVLGDVRLQYRKLFIPNQAHLAYYHTGNQEAVFNGLTRRWGSWVKGNPLPFAFRKAQPSGENQIVLLDRTLDQSVARWGALSVARGDKNAYALLILEQYLTLSLPGWAGQVAGASQVRASVSVETRTMPGFVAMNLQTPPPQVAGYLKKFIDTLSEIQQGQIDKQRFEEAKRLAFMEVRSSLENPDGLLRQLLETSLYNLGVNYILNFGVRIDRFTPELFQTATKEHFSGNNLVIVVAGPAESLQSQLSGFGKVRLLN